MWKMYNTHSQTVAMDSLLLYNYLIVLTLKKLENEMQLFVYFLWKFTIN